jgi:hypothetical protein
VFTYAY